MILDFKRSEFLAAIDEMEALQHRIQYITDLVQSAAVIADPQLQLALRNVLQKLENLEQSYRKRIAGSEEITESYDLVEQQISSSLEYARESIQKLF